MTERVVDTEVLVVGGGGAGFRAAIAARESGAEATLLSKGPLARCGATPMAGADFTAYGQGLNEIEGVDGHPDDTPEKMMNDILTHGWFLNNQRLVEQYVERSPQVCAELIELGMPLRGMDGNRAIYSNGIACMNALHSKAKSVGVELLEDIMLLDLVVHGYENRVVGAVALHIPSGDLVLFRAKAVVMATGGWHKAFWPTTGMRDLSGEGIAAALRAGAHIGNMEFVTFCANVFMHPPMWRGSIAPYVMSMAGGTLTNALGAEFFNKYDPFVVERGTTTEWNKSFISLVSAEEIRAGRGTPHGGVYYRRGDTPWEDIEQRAENLFENWKWKGLDLSEWEEMLKNDIPVEVGPAAEYFDGGIVVNKRFETTVPGLYAAGECTLGPFGANRVFAATTEMLVHGLDAGTNAARFASKASDPGVTADDARDLVHIAEEPLRRKKGQRAAEITRELAEAAHNKLGPMRNEEELKSLIGLLDSVQDDVIPRLATAAPENRRYNKDWVEAIELRNIVQILQFATHSALARTESRGVHYREDFPYCDNDNWLRESIIKPVNGRFEVTHRPITTTTMKLPFGKERYFDMLKIMMALHSDIPGGH